MYVYWPRMQEDVAQFIRGCILCYTINHNNKKQGLYYPLPIPTTPCESIYMDFMGGFPTTREGCNYQFVVVDMFNKMCILIPLKKTTKRQYATKMLFEKVWVHFGIPRSLILNKDTRFLNSPSTTLWEKIFTKLKRPIDFNPQTTVK